jgi:hypothetical protein
MKWFMERPLWSTLSLQNFSTSYIWRFKRLHYRHMNTRKLCLSIYLPLRLSIHPSIHPSIPVAPTWSIDHGWNASFRFRFLILLSRTPSKGDQPVARPLPNTTENKCKQTSMPSVWFKPTIPMFERTKTFHALDYAANMIGNKNNKSTKLRLLILKRKLNIGIINCVWVVFKDSDCISPHSISRETKIMSISFCCSNTADTLLGMRQSYITLTQSTLLQINRKQKLHTSKMKQSSMNKYCDVLHKKPAYSEVHCYATAS